MLQVVEKFQSCDVVLVMAPDQSVLGLVTPSDIAKEFGAMAEPFFLVGEIEALLRLLIKGNNIAVDEFLPQEEETTPKDVVVDRLDLGQLQYIVQNPKAWANLGIFYDRKLFCETLDRVREARNAVMHFREALTNKQLEEVKRFLEMVREICTFREKEGWEV